MLKSDLITLHVAALVRGFESAGWRLLAVEMDLSRETARIEARRADGLHVTFDARDGRASLTREIFETKTVKVGRRGDVFRVERVCPRFLGRSSGMGVRQGLRFFCDYIANNAVRPLTAGDIRDMLRPLMDGSTYALNA